MSIKVAVYISGFIFAIWSYIVLIYTISTIGFARIKSDKVFGDVKAIVLQAILFTLTLIGQIFTVYLYVKTGKNLIKDGGTTTTEYGILISLNFVAILFYLSFYLFFSNNLAVKFTDEKTYLIGISIINSAFIKIQKDAKGNVEVEYLYNQNKDKKWTEKLKFFHFLPSTQFFGENYKKFIDPERNLALFDVYKVSKKQDDEIKDAEIKTEKAKTIEKKEEK